MCKWVMPPITITQAGALISGDGLKRDYVSWNQISSHVKLAALAAEDQLFAEHDGFDWTSLRKSLDGNNKHGIGSAASTISQQTAKNVFLWQGDGLTKYIRKIPEFYFTKMIEWIWGKERILEIYLNCIEMGKGIYGIEAAAQTYFKKPANDLSKMEAAQIIACLPNPKIYTVKPKSKFVSWKSSWIQRQMTNLQSDDAIKSLIESEPEK
jgi:monofunctional biosynthetic peptidoglycan transglycosylase